MSGPGARIAPGDERAAIRAALDALPGVALLRGVFDDGPGRAVLSVLRLLARATPDADAVASAYGHAFATLAGVARDAAGFGPRDAWQGRLIARVLDDVNPWSLAAEESGAQGVAVGLRAQAERDLRALQRLFVLDADAVWRAARDAVARDTPALSDAWVPWRDLAPLVEAAAIVGENAARAAMGRELAGGADWAACVDTLGAYWARHGTGTIGRYAMLRWMDGEVRPIVRPDPIALDTLVGYEREQALLRTNTERFLAGLPAHDALLYGAPGTGKSSTVKAIANTYAGRGLRLVEVRKDDLGDLPAIAEAIEGRAPRFVVFVDDLSFEEHETEYKALKAILEGTAAARPANLLLYATTNRRNLVRETFAERGAPGDDVHGRDTIGEKVSLAARFGLRVTFASPDQERYVAIASALARGRGLALSGDELRARALRWEREHPGRSGRTARHFVDDVEAELRGLPST